MAPLMAFARNVYSGFVRTCGPAKQPEPLYEEERPTLGFFAMLTDKQKADAVAYQGPDNLGRSTDRDAS